MSLYSNSNYLSTTVSLLYMVFNWHVQNYCQNYTVVWKWNYSVINYCTLWWLFTVLVFCVCVLGNYQCLQIISNYDSLKAGSHNDPQICISLCCINAYSDYTLPSSEQGNTKIGSDFIFVSATLHFTNQFSYFFRLQFSSTRKNRDSTAISNDWYM